MHGGLDNTGKVCLHHEPIPFNFFHLVTRLTLSKIAGCSRCWSCSRIWTARNPSKNNAGCCNFDYLHPEIVVNVSTFSWTSVTATLKSGKWTPTRLWPTGWWFRYWVLIFTSLSSHLSHSSPTCHKLGERRALEQRGADEEVHADLCSRSTEPQEVLCPQWHLPLPGRGENFEVFFKSSGIACRGLLTYLYSPLFIHFYTYIPFKLCSKVFNEGEESVGTSSLPLDSAEIEPAQIKVFHLYMRLCV